MKRQRGLTLTELVVSGMLLIFTLTGVLGLMISGMRSFERTTSDINLTQPNSQAVRRMSETLRQALWVSISPSGDRIDYELPKLAASPDSYTGEKELIVPLESDGVKRYFHMRGDKIVYMPDKRVLVSGLSKKDPDPNSTQFDQNCDPFQTTTIGAKNAVTINLITREEVNGKPRYTRMKSTVMVQNIR